MAHEHRFQSHLAWKAPGDETFPSNHVVRFDGRPELGVSAAPGYGGDPARLNPEELLLASIASCQMLTMLALAKRAGLAIESYEDHPEAILAMAERKMRITEVRLRPRIQLAAGADREKARRLVDQAHEGCFVASSVSCAIVIEPEIS